MAKRISVIIPTFNRKVIIEKCLKALSSQTYPRPDFEILLIDNGSTDGTIDMINKISAALPFELRCFSEPKKGPASARNIGIKNARGKIILFLGDDTIASPSLLEEHYHWHTKYPDDNVAILGHLTWSKDINPTPFMEWLERGGIQSKYTQIKNPDNVDPEIFFYSSNISLKGSFMLSNNAFFDESFPWAAFEDIELGYRLKKAGLIIKYNSAAIGYHYHYTSLNNACHRMIIIGQSSQILARKKGVKSYNLFLVFVTVAISMPIFIVFYLVARLFSQKAISPYVYWYLIHYCYAIGVIKYRVSIWAKN